MPINLLAQSAVLFCPYRFRKFDGTQWFNLCRGDTFSTAPHSPPLEGWQAQPDGVVVKGLHRVMLIDFDIRTVEKISSLHKPNRLRHQIHAMTLLFNSPNSPIY